LESPLATTTKLPMDPPTTTTNTVTAILTAPSAPLSLSTNSTMLNYVLIEFACSQGSNAIPQTWLLMATIKTTQKTLCSLLNTWLISPKNEPGLQGSFTPTPSAPFCLNFNLNQQEKASSMEWHLLSLTILTLKTVQ
jgi:hypothetical protein